MSQEQVGTILILSLIGLNVFQLVYWSRQTHKLIDKIMSRNYAEYESVSRPQAPLPTPQVEITDDQDDDLQRLNGIMAGIN